MDNKNENEKETRGERTLRLSRETKLGNVILGPGEERKGFSLALCWSDLFEDDED